MSANNEEGSSKWSDAVKYRTLPDRPGAPQRPQVKGKVHPTSFRVNWDDPRDSGGSEITKFILELDEGRGFDEVYKGPEKDYNCDRLLPGQTYRCRLCCFSKGGKSDWSDSMAVTLPPVTPGPCLPPKLRGKPKATSVCLQWGYPDYDGGAPVTVFEINMTNPDSSNRECYKGPDLECTVAGLLPGRPYLFQVRASNKAGCGPWSERVELISGAGVPDAPKTPSVHCKSPHSAMIWWEEPVNNGATITDYRLEWSTGGDSDFTQLYYGPGLTYEVKSLTPASEYCFRVQAINATGVGPVSDSCTCVTPPSSPSTVTSIRTTTTADSISISWREPQCNGSEILSYNIDIGERHLIPVGNVTDFTIDSLIPETTYKVRIQALNGIGVGAFSSPIKVTTRSLPPPPPHLECVLAGPNSLKLKWGEGRNPDMLQYILEMKRDNGSFYHVYQGPSQMQKVNRLQETTDYFFRISASNEAGEGPYSEVYQFTTTKAPPPAVKAPKVSDISLEGASVEWSPCKQMGKDPLNYVLQVQSKNEEYKQIYSGSETMYKLSYLEPNTEYVVRVCAERLCQDGSGSLLGAFSPGIIFYTHSQEPIKTVGVKSESGESSEPKQLTDQQWAMIILAVCAFLAILLAFLAKQFISYSKPS
ncbi:unnamed protein product [Owenia fusiformis]|uniref:Uncharacterized protein n=1 Tax=Owenia fusiformis TaxID=6347 RepID=A0A8J1UDB8_OWEFU|nr:unnamed protein product [Owenia fusiformis]